MRFPTPVHSTLMPTTSAMASSGMNSVMIVMRCAWKPPPKNPNTHATSKYMEYVCTSDVNATMTPTQMPGRKCKSYHIK